MDPTQPPDRSPTTPPTPPARPAPSLDDALEREISEALGDMSMDDLIELSGSDDGGKGADDSSTPERSERAPAPSARHKGRAPDRSKQQRRKPRGSQRDRAPKPERQIRVGRIMRIHDGDVFVEFGNLMQGVCPLVQFGEETPEVGSEREFILERMDAFEGLHVLSLPGATQKADWEHLEVGQVVEARCIGMNKGGLEMEVAHHKAFMPAGQVDLRHVPDISVFLGQKFPCQILELRKEKGRLVLSRKAALAQERARKRDEILDTLEEGQQIRATVTSVQPYGAFADIGGIDGLIHIADLAHERLKHPSEVVKVGDELEVKILRIDRSQQPPKIALGRKQIMADPVLQKMSEIVIGATVTGRVTRLTEFGAFVEIATGLEGLVHISEVSHDRIPSVDRVLKRDQIVTAKVLSVDADRKRVSLSIKALVERPARPGSDADTPARPDGYLRDEDPAMRKLKARFSSSSQLKGGIG
ncbi:MAG: S1 RNA-binding domain-containing protein [Phycisphaeraceae bacterium]|nr:S1 RNA-binding domain-containing protein [Phycisphaeraceae bacterium]